MHGQVVWAHGQGLPVYEATEWVGFVVIEWRRAKTAQVIFVREGRPTSFQRCKRDDLAGYLKAGRFRVHHARGQ